MLLGAVLSANAMGASVDAIMNYTPSYLGNPAQNATTDVDGAFYNPAGLTALEEGVHMHLGVQAAKVGFEMTDKRLANPKKYEGKDDLSIVPSFALVKKQGDFAYFMNMGGAAGGPSLKYSDGVPMFNSINSILGGQAAQTLVGGGMFVHNIHQIHDFFHAIPMILTELIMGLIVGLVAFLLWQVVLKVVKNFKRN